MRLSGAYIQGFGCFSERSFSFDEGLNVFLRENGSGKTTLSCFLRVMFFGFQNENRRTEGAKEREKRRPWKGSSYGGSVDFVYQGRKYRIERTFGKKAQFDTLHVYDMQSMTETDRFGSEPGQVIFGIDSDTFERTAFMGETPVPASVSDGVHAKLGNLMEDVTDVGQYNDADKRLKDLENHLGTRSTGETAIVTNRITELQNALREKDNVERAVRQNDLKKDGAMRRAAEMAGEREEVLKKQAELSKYLSLASRKDKSESLKESLEARRNALQAVSQCFPFGVPDEEAVAEAESKLASAKDLKERLGSEGFTEEEEARFQELAERFAGRKLFENEEETYTEKSEKAQSLSADMRVRYERAKEAEKTLKTKTENAKRASALLKAVPIGGVLMTAAALSIAGILKSNILAVVGTILGILTVLGSVYAFFVRKKAQKEKEQTEKDCNELKADLSRMEEEKGNLTESLKGFFGRFGRSYELETGTVELHRLFREYREYERMTERKSVHSQDLREIDEKMRSVRSFLLDFVPAPSDDMTEELRALRTRVFSYHTAETEFVNAKRAYDEFESDPESSVLQDIRKPDFQETAEQLTSRLAELNREIDEIREESESYQREETRLSEKMETLFDAEAELDELFVKRSILADRLETVRMARSFLKEAKQSLSEKVTDPVTKGFRDYVSDIVPDMKTSLNISSDGNAVFEEGSAIRGVDLFSQGYRTLTYFALRLSLMDQMFENDAPPLFLDDPFQSLDESKLKTALKLLKKASERYQILYFTCHESRSEASVSVQ